MRLISLILIIKAISAKINPHNKLCKIAFLENVLNKENIVPNVVFVDPPRKGLDKHTIQNILNLKPERFVYISCNPATLMRDLKELEEDYEIQEIQPVDMFPFTSHVETIAVLCLKETTNPLK